MSLGARALLLPGLSTHVVVTMALQPHVRSSHVQPSPPAPASQPLRPECHSEPQPGHRLSRAPHSNPGSGSQLSPCFQREDVVRVCPLAFALFLLYFDIMAYCPSERKPHLFMYYIFKENAMDFELLSTLTEVNIEYFSNSFFLKN